MEGVGSIKDDFRRHFRMKLKNIFIKFIRKFGFELVKSMLPAEHHKVLVNICKAEARTKSSRLADEDHNDSDSEDDTLKVRGESIEEILAESDSDMSDDECPTGSKTQKKLTKQKGRDREINHSFLDPTVSQRVLGNIKTKERTFQDGHYDDDMELEPQLKYKAGGSRIHRPLGRSRDLWGDYKAKKGKGDVKGKGKVDPYAYIPLRKAQLNHRKKAKMQCQFKGMVRGAQKGTQSGKRMQRNKRRA